MTAAPQTPTATSHVPLRDSLVLVAVGGACGTAARWLLSTAFGSTEGLSAGVISANVIGAMLLGYLFVVLAQSSASAPRRARLELLLGVGLLGGFTTYSTLAVHGAEYLIDGAWWSALWRMTLQVLLGLAGAVLGMVLGMRQIDALAPHRNREGVGATDG